MEKNKKVLTEKQVERNNAIKDFIKSLIVPSIVCLFILGMIAFVVTYQTIEKPREVIQPYAYDGSEEPVVMENDEIKFTMDPTTTQFEVLVKSTGKVWKSNPEGAANDSLALTEEKAKLQSTLVMSYNTETGLETTYDTHSYSIANGIYEIEQGDDYIRVNYSLGKVQKEFTIPPVLTKESYKKWTKLMETKEADLVSQYYKKYDIKKLSAKDNKEELLSKYPILADSVIYVLRNTTKDSVKGSMEESFAKAGYTYDDYLADKELDQSVASNDNPIFNVSMIYRLNGGDLEVEVPFSSLAFAPEYPIYTITPLPYFGAGSDSESGFMMVPEGGGAIINFNNGKVSQNSYYANVYGWDMCLSRKAVVHNTRACFEAFGISDASANSMICVLEDGKSYAAIQSDIAGKNNSYNYVNAVYSICQREQYDVGDISNSEIYKYIEELPDESLKQRYSFVDSGSYVDMAKDYGDILQEKYGSYLSLNSDTSVPIAVEIVGAVDKIKQILGVPVSKPLPLTTYEEATEMVRDLKNDGLENLSVTYSGWCNGGVNQKILKKVKPIRSLGSKSDLNNLTATAKELGVNLYLNGITQYEHQSNILDGFISYRDAAKLISKERCELYQYSAITYAAREGAKSYYLLHTDVAQRMTDNLISAAKKYNTGVAFEDIGKDLSADYYKKKPYSREAVLKLQEAKLKEINDSGMPLMVSMGNDYAVPYASLVTDMELRGNDYTILDGQVPFYQLAIHGYIDYTGYALNISGDDTEELLRSAEYGAGLQFTMMKESAFTLQKTLYTEYYGSDYDAWHDRMLDIYTRYNNELGHTFNQEMTDHINITDTLACTTYADGTKVYVNYDYVDAETEGVKVPARDYLVIK